MYPIHVLYAVIGWEESVLRQRCLLGNRFASRLATPHEAEIVTHNHRAVSYKYRDLDGLISDEERAGSSPEFIQTLKDAWNKYGNGG